MRCHDEHSLLESATTKKATFYSELDLRFIFTQQLSLIRVQINQSIDHIAVSNLIIMVDSIAIASGTIVTEFTLRLLLWISFLRVC